MPPKKPRVPTLLDYMLDYVMKKTILPRALQVAKKWELYLKKGYYRSGRRAELAIFEGNVEMYGALDVETMAKVHARMREYIKKRECDDLLGLIPEEDEWNYLEKVQIMDVFQRLMLHEKMLKLDVADPSLIIANIGKFRELRKVQINDDELAAVLLPRRDTMANVTELTFECDHLPEVFPNIGTDEMVKKIARNCPKLEKLCISRCRVSRACFPYLKKLTHLTELNITDTSIPTSYQAKICLELPSLTELKGANIEGIVKAWKFWNVDRATKLHTVAMVDPDWNYYITYSDVKKFFPQVKDLSLTSLFVMTEDEKQLGPLPCLISLKCMWNVPLLELHAGKLEALAVCNIRGRDLAWIGAHHPDLIHFTSVRIKQKKSDFKLELEHFLPSGFEKVTTLVGECATLKVLLPRCKDVRIVRIFCDDFQGTFSNARVPESDVMSLLKTNEMQKLEIFHTHFCFDSKWSVDLAMALLQKCPNLKMLCDADFELGKNERSKIGKYIQKGNYEFMFKPLIIFKNMADYTKVK